MTGRQFVEVSCVIRGDQSEIGGAGGGLTGEQVDGTHWPAPTGQQGFTFPQRSLSNAKSLKDPTENAVRP